MESQLSSQGLKAINLALRTHSALKDRQTKLGQLADSKKAVHYLKTMINANGTKSKTEMSVL